MSDDSDVWRLARQCQSQLHGDAILAKVFQGLDRHKNITKAAIQTPKSKPSDLVRNKLMGDFGVNNFGKSYGVARPGTAPFKVGSMTGASSSAGKPISLNVCTIGDSINIILQCGTHILTRPMAEELLSKLMTILVTVVGQA